MLSVNINDNVGLIVLFLLKKKINAFYNIRVLLWILLQRFSSTLHCNMFKFLKSQICLVIRALSLSINYFYKRNKTKEIVRNIRVYLLFHSLRLSIASTLVLSQFLKVCKKTKYRKSILESSQLTVVCDTMEKC